MGGAKEGIDMARCFGLQGGLEIRLTMERIEGGIEPPSRPQEPERPFPYDDEEVRYPNPDGGHELAGTLTLPRSAGPHPAVVLVSGSGPQDRDEMVMQHRPFLVLSKDLDNMHLFLKFPSGSQVFGSGLTLLVKTLGKVECIPVGVRNDRQICNGENTGNFVLLAEVMNRGPASLGYTAQKGKYRLLSVVLLQLTGP